MNLNNKLRKLIVEKFKAGASMAEIANWYSKSTDQIEGVIRGHMNEETFLKQAGEKI